MKLLVFVLTHVSLSLFRAHSFISLSFLRFLLMHTRSVSRFFFVDRATSLLLLCDRSRALLPSLLLFRFFVFVFALVSLSRSRFRYIVRAYNRI